MPDTLPTELSLQMILDDLQLPDTSVKLYDLPEGVVCAMGALFLGEPIDPDDRLNAIAYFYHLLKQFESRAQTACLTVTLPTMNSTCLGFIHNGKFCGCYLVEDQEFGREVEVVEELLQSDQDATVEASLLPLRMSSPLVRIGFSLSSAKKRGSAI
jgi:hypothetical protein